MRYHTAKAVAEQLKKRGFTVIGTPTEIDDMCEQVDGNIDITPAISVQVGHNYYVVNSREGEGESARFHFSEPCATIEQLVIALNKVIAKEQTHEAPGTIGARKAPTGNRP